MKRHLGCYDPYRSDGNETIHSNLFIFLGGFKLMLPQSKRELKTVNNAVRICIECGSISVIIDNRMIFCKNCNSKFRIKEESNGSFM